MNIDSLPNEPGVYAIHCKLNDFIYVGSASSIPARGCKGIKKRVKEHLSALNKGIHPTPVLQNHWNKYGANYFEAYVLEICAPEDCLRFEQNWIDIRGVGYKNKSYNILPTAGSNLGNVPSEETRRRISEARSSKRYLVISPDGIEQEIKSLNKFCNENGLTTANMQRVASGKSAQHKGWRCRYLNPEDCEKYDLKEVTTASNSFSKKWIVTSPEGEVFTVEGLYSFAKQQGLAVSKLSKVARGEMSHHKGWFCQYADPEEASQFQPKTLPQIKTYLVTSPEGKSCEVTNLREFCRNFNAPFYTLHKLSQGKIKKNKEGWKCKLVEKETA